MQLSGANFQGTPVALPMDMAGLAITMVSLLSERRMNRLNNPALSAGLFFCTFVIITPRVVLKLK